MTECAPNCVDKECGEDGCGAECGTCPGAAPICNAQTQLCELECTPDCEGKDCGPDGCGESCGTCPQNETVCDDTSGQCVCEPQCEEGQECGDDGCEGTCGDGCDAGETCNGENACVCTPQCESKECGDDGCGGSCGTCNANSTCSPQGLCSIACDEDWDETVLLLQSDTSNETSSIIDSTANHSISEIGDVHHETDEKKFGSSALYFDDESGLEIPYSSDFNWLDGSDFTAEAWVYANAFDNEPGNNAIMAQAGNNGNWTNGVGDDCGIQWHLSHLAEYENTNEIEDHSLFLQYFGGNNDTGTTLWVADSVSGFSLETWHHVAFVADSSGVRLYVDGVKHDESTEIIGTMQGTPNLLVGGLRSSGWPRNCWNGYIEEVRISQIARYTADFSSSLPTHMFAAQACDPTPTCDENWNETVFLLQSDSSDGNTSFVDSSSSGHAINVNEDVQHDTNEQQWGTSSIYFDGEDDYLELPNNATDFDFGQGNFTIEFWARWADIDTQHTLISKRSPTIYRTYWAISKYPDDYTPGKNAKLQFAANSGGNGSSSTDNDWHLLIESNIPDNLNFTTNQWYHIALVRSGIEEEDTKFYLNGVALATNLYDDSPLVGPLQNVSWSNTIPTFEGKLHVGANVQESAAAISYGTAGISGEFEGHLEDLRITKGHARYTTDFSPPNQSFAAMACE